MQKTKTLTTLLLLIIVFSLSACGNKGKNGAAIGATIGAIAGQAIGRSTEATLIGATVGAALGYGVGNEMDKYDRQELNHIYERGVSGQTNTWVNPDKGQRQMTPQPAYNNSIGQTCRNAEIAAIINGKWQVVDQTACRDNNGHWQLQSSR